MYYILLSLWANTAEAEKANNKKRARSKVEVKSKQEITTPDK